jgi:hypothetical protein
MTATPVGTVEAPAGRAFPHGMPTPVAKTPAMPFKIHVSHLRSFVCRLKLHLRYILDRSLQEEI